MLAWGPWVREMLDLIDHEGTLRHFPESGAWADQPARSMLIINIARNRWIERMNQSTKDGT